MHLDPNLRDKAQGSPESSSSTTASPSQSQPGHVDSTTTDSPQAAADEATKKARACESCRGLKVRCEPDPNDEGPCKRCKKAGRNCVVTMPTRKRQKKTDSRVSELEKKIDALTASLHARVAPPAPHQQEPPLSSASASAPAANTHANDSYASHNWSRTQPPVEWGNEPNRMYGIGGPGWNHERHSGGSSQKRKAPMDEEKQDRRPSLAAAAAGWPAYTNNPTERDIVDRGLVSMELASQLFARFRNQMMPHLPCIVFPAEYTVSDLRRTQPTLFLSVMTAASGEQHALQRVLQKELMQTLATKVVATGEKSIELVQALNVAVIWYWPPEYFEELKFYQLVHMAAVMAIDIGLGRSRTGSKRTGFAPSDGIGWRDHHAGRRVPLPDPTTLESRRTWLTCYYLASNTAMSLHRPNLIRWTAFMAESKDVLESSPDAAPSDKYFCHLVWTHHLGEEVGTQFSMDDPAIKVNITDVRTQYTLKALERDLEKYMSSTPAEHMQPTLKIGFNVINLYMHEMALHVDTSNDQLRPPFNTDSLRDGLVGSETMSSAHINALSACLTSIDDIFDTFLAMDISSIRCLPVFNFVRVAYAVVVLMKMFFSASNTGSDLGTVINRDNMRVQHYLDSLLEKFRATAAEDKCRPASKFLVVLAMLRSWFVKQNSTATTQSSGNPTAANDSNIQQQQANHSNSNLHTTSVAANSPLHLLSEVASGHESRSSSHHHNQPYLYSTTQQRQNQTPSFQPATMPPQEPDFTSSSSMQGAAGASADVDPGAIPAWMPPNMMGDFNFDPATGQVNMNILDGSNDLWYNDMFQGLPDPNLFPF